MKVKVHESVYIYLTISKGPTYLLRIIILDYLFILFFWIDNCDNELRTKLQMHAILQKAIFLIWKNKKQFTVRNFYFTYQPTFQVLSYVTYTPKVV